MTGRSTSPATAANRVPQRRSQSPPPRESEDTRRQRRVTRGNSPVENLSTQLSSTPLSADRPQPPPHQSLSEWRVTTPSDPTSSSGAESGPSLDDSPSKPIGRSGRTSSKGRPVYNAEAGPSSRTRSQAGATEGHATYVTELTPPESPGSVFSFSSAVETARFREDEGRLYNATQDDYALPADSAEAKRLDIEHKALKLYLGSNYVGPVAEHLRSTPGVKRRVLDVGCGTGRWCTEMASEFSDVQFTGIDLVPLQPDSRPENVDFIIDDILQGLPFDDETFDMIHVRTLMTGIRDYQALLRSCARVLKKGGLFLSSEGELSINLWQNEEDNGSIPFVRQYQEMARAGVLTRGLDPYLALRIPAHFAATGLYGEVTTLKAELPIGQWPEDENMNAISQLMLLNTLEFPETVRLLILDGAGVTRQDYESVKAGYLAEIVGRRFYLPYWMSWAFKK